MAKKKKSQETEAASTSTTSSPATPSPSTSPEAAAIDGAFANGNFSLVRTLGARAESSEAKAAFARVFPLIDVERGTLLVGAFGFLVVLIAASLALTRG